MKRRWFLKAVNKKPPYSLGGWKKSLSPSVRRRKALMSRPKNWDTKKRYLSAARALIALKNVTKDEKTKEAALVDARYFLKKYKKGKLNKSERG